jgi:hypothetical protein
MYAMIGRVVMAFVGIASPGPAIVVFWTIAEMLHAGGPFHAALGGG